MMFIPRGNVILSFSIKLNWEAAPKEIGYTVTDFDGHEFEQGRIVIDSKFESGVSTIRDDLNNHFQKYIHCNTLSELKNKIYATWLEKKKEHTKVFAITEDCPYWIRVKPVYGVLRFLNDAGINKDNYPRVYSELPAKDSVNDARYQARLYITAFNKLNPSSNTIPTYDSQVQHNNSTALQLHCNNHWKI